MATADLGAPLREFADFTHFRAPLAPLTHLKIGGAADALVQPRTLEELAAVVRRCSEQKIGLRVLGGGGNLLVRDEGVRGVVVSLSAPAFTHIDVDGARLRAGGGATLTALIATAARHGLAGLEILVGTAGCVGGAVRHNAGERGGDISHFVRRVEVMEATGQVQLREHDDLRFGYRSSNFDDPVIVSGEFELERDSAAAIVKRLRKAWIERQGSQPFSFQAAARLFRNPRGLSAAAMIEQAGLAGTRVGAAELSDRHPNYVVAGPGATARDVLRLIDLVKSRLRERFHVDLELELSIW